MYKRSVTHPEWGDCLSQEEVMKSTFTPMKSSNECSDLSLLLSVCIGVDTLLLSCPLFPHPLSSLLPGPSHLSSHSVTFWGVWFSHQPWTLLIRKWNAWNYSMFIKKMSGYKEWFRALRYTLGKITLVLVFNYGVSSKRISRGFKRTIPEKGSEKI